MGITELRGLESFGVEHIEVVEYNIGGNGRSQILRRAGSVKLGQVNHFMPFPEPPRAEAACTLEFEQ